MCDQALKMETVSSQALDTQDDPDEMTILKCEIEEIQFTPMTT